MAATEALVAAHDEISVGRQPLWLPAASIDVAV